MHDTYCRALLRCKLAPHDSGYPISQSLWVVACPALAMARLEPMQGENFHEQPLSTAGLALNTRRSLSLDRFLGAGSGLPGRPGKLR